MSCRILPGWYNDPEFFFFLNFNFLQGIWTNEAGSGKIWLQFYVIKMSGPSLQKCRRKRLWDIFQGTLVCVDVGRRLSYFVMWVTFMIEFWPEEKEEGKGSIRALQLSYPGYEQSWHGCQLQISTSMLMRNWRGWKESIHWSVKTSTLSASLQPNQKNIQKTNILYSFIFILLIQVTSYAFHWKFPAGKFEPKAMAICWR